MVDAAARWSRCHLLAWPDGTAPRRRHARLSRAFSFLLCCSAAFGRRPLRCRGRRRGGTSFARRAVFAPGSQERRMLCWRDARGRRSAQVRTRRHSPCAENRAGCADRAGTAGTATRHVAASCAGDGLGVGRPALQRTGTERGHGGDSGDKPSCSINPPAGTRKCRWPLPRRTAWR